MGVLDKMIDRDKHYPLTIDYVFKKEKKEIPNSLFQVLDGGFRWKNSEVILSHTNNSCKILLWIEI